MWAELPQNKRDEYKNQILAFASLTETFAQKSEHVNEKQINGLRSTVNKRHLEKLLNDIEKTINETYIGGKINEESKY